MWFQVSPQSYFQPAFQWLCGYFTKFGSHFSTAKMVAKNNLKQEAPIILMSALVPIGVQGSGVWVGSFEGSS